MLRSCLKSAWRVLSSPSLQYSNVGLKILSRPLLEPNSHYISYFSKPIAIQPSINEFLKSPTTKVEFNQNRALTKFSLRKGKRKSVRAVVKRFYRLNWGIWIRTRCGRHKKLYKKSANRKRRLRQHVFTNATQSWLLDKMVTRYWRKPRFYVDDPYEPYHKREEFIFSRRRPFVPYN
ncbi:large ribosomal subunit protein bL35m [Halyomorpha halys]|uniref:large ribosomal subunit protein bL35m n=1 Tax=Halyomorpha halys TaxID=286706 RepID=UPI0006D52621|nr:39S ribosomal protein L35, mitochondrial [Halyomorpha halys]